MAFRIGQKVVCVNDSPILVGKTPVSLHIKSGEIYIVRAVGECPYEPWRPHGSFVWLEGIVRDDPSWPDFPFIAHRFRPLIEKSTDAGMAVLREILDRVNGREPVSIHD